MKELKNRADAEKTYQEMLLHSCNNEEEKASESAREAMKLFSMGYIDYSDYEYLGNIQVFEGNYKKAGNFYRNGIKNLEDEMIFEVDYYPFWTRRRFRKLNEDEQLKKKRMYENLRYVDYKKTPPHLLKKMRRKKRDLKLICFDLDGTLTDVKENIWVELNERFGTVSENKLLEPRYRRGEIDYARWASEAFEILQNRGINRNNLYNAISSVHLIQGALETLNELKKDGKKLGIISGSLDISIPEEIKEFFDEILINRIEFDSNGDISRFIPTPYGDGYYKEKGLIHIAWLKKCPLSRCVFVGNGSNDLLAAQRAGISMALNPESIDFEDKCDISIRNPNIKEILEYLI